MRCFQAHKFTSVFGGVSGANYYKLYHKSNYIVCKFDNEFKVNKNKN